MKIKFWGIRGSVPAPGPDFVEYGGNTTFVTIHEVDGWEENEYLALDFGSAAKDFSQCLGRDASPKSVKLLSLFSHFHWDHINGFPFFAPVYAKGNLIRLFSTNRIGLKQSIGMQSNGINFPVDIEEVDAALDYSQILHCERIYAPSVAGAVSALRDTGDALQMASTHGLVIDTLPLNHPQGSTGYRIREPSREKTFVYITDHESNRYMDLGLVEFISDSSLIYMDGMYENDNIKSFKGYGHSSWEECADKFRRARNVKRMLIGHHNFTATDEELSAIDAELCSTFRNGEVALAKEGMEIEI